MYLRKEQKFFALLKKIFTSSHIKTALIVSLLTIGIMLYAAPAKIPNIFKYGDIVSSSQINANFQKLVDEINQLKAQIGGAPAGAIIPFGGPELNIPPGWLLCDGRSIARTDYPELFARIDISWGAEDGDHFNLPDLRGVFLRGINSSIQQGVRSDAFQDPDAVNRVDLFGAVIGNKVGSYQSDEFKFHSHNIRSFDGATGSSSGIASDPTSSETTYDHYTQGIGGNETRPKNAAVYYIIKY